MADHGKNYIRTVSENGDGEVGRLGPECGHHCGVITVGHSDEHVGHCHCKECHGDVSAIMQQMIPSNFTSDTGGVNPNGIV